VKTNGASRELSALIDANTNRAKEGLRVCEDIARFILKNKRLSSVLKNLRHGIDASLPLSYAKLLDGRDSEKDAGRRIKCAAEFKRHSLREVLASNFKRSQESLRVLEEIIKLYSPKSAGLFKELRYKSYTAEKTVMSFYDKKN